MFRVLTLDMYITLVIPRTLRQKKDCQISTVLTSFPLLKKRRAAKIDHTEIAKKFYSNFLTEAKI